MATFRGILLTDSPYYITETGSQGFTSTVELRVWNGSKLSVPSSPTTTLVKQTLSTTDTRVTFEIAKIISTSLEHSFGVYTQSASSNTDAMWVSVKTYNGSVNTDDLYLAVDGYSEFLEGINVLPTNTTLISERILYHHEGIPIRFPVVCDGVDNANTVEFRLGNTVVDTVDLSLLINSNFSYDKINYINHTTSEPGDIDNILVKNSIGTVIDTITVKPSPCTRFNPYVVSFINKFGVNQELIFSLSSKKRVNVTTNSYNKQLLDTTSTPTYDVTKHKHKRYNSNTSELITLNTNFIDESLNETISELVSSESVWLTVDGITSPVNLTTKTLEYKTGVNNGLINYTLDFEYAFNKRNNIY